MANQSRYLYIIPLLAFTVFGMGASGCPLQSSSSDSTSSDTSDDGSSDDGSGSGSTADPTLTALVGIWDTACIATTDIDGASAWMRTSLQITSGSTFSYVIAYYPNSSCSGEMIWLDTPGTLVVGAATTAPASGHLLRFTLGNGGGLHTSSAAGAVHLNTQCGHGSIFSSNGGILTNSAWSCSSDARFTRLASSNIVDLAIVVSGNNLATTSLTFNAPGVLNGVAVDSSTSVTFTK
jgi:hypothetical protein